MGSNIDPSFPIEVNPTTASVRQNFGYAKSEIEALQGAITGVGVDLANFVTAAQLVDARAGVLSFNADVPLQAAIDQAAALASYVNNNSPVTVSIPAGAWKLSAQVIVKNRVLLAGFGVLVNFLASSTTACVRFKAGSHSSRISVDANGKRGISIDEVGVSFFSSFDNIYVSNIGTAANQQAVTIVGNDIRIGNIYLNVGGSVGVLFGDGVLIANAAYRVFVNSIRSIRPKIGCQILGGFDITVGAVLVDSPDTTAVMADACYNVSCPNIRTYWNDFYVSANKFSAGGAVILGDNSPGNSVSSSTFGVHGSNTNGPVVRVKEIQQCLISSQASTATALSGNAVPATFAINFIAGGSGQGNQFRIATGNALPGTNGTPTGAIFSTSGLNSVIGAGGGGYLQIDTLSWGLSGTLFGLVSIASTIDQSLTNNTVLTTAANFGAIVTPAAVAGEDWQIEWTFKLGAALATTGFKIGVICSGGAPSGGKVNVTYIPDVPNAANRAYKDGAIGATLAFTAAELAGAASAFVRVVAQITGAPVGFVYLQFAQNTNSATPLTLFGGATLQARRSA